MCLLIYLCTNVKLKKSVFSIDYFVVVFINLTWSNKNIGSVGDALIPAKNEFIEV